MTYSHARVWNTALAAHLRERHTPVHAISERSRYDDRNVGEGPAWTLPEAYLKAVAEHGTVKSYPKNTMIVSEGDRSDSLYVVLSGKVKVYLADEDGKEILLNTQGPGEYFGEIILDEGPRSASVMTLEPSKFSIVSKAQAQEFLAAHPDAALELIRA